MSQEIQDKIDKIEKSLKNASIPASAKEALKKQKAMLEAKLDKKEDVASATEAKHIAEEKKN